VKQIKLNNRNQFIKVDDEDYNRISLYSWGIYGTNKYPRSTTHELLSNLIIEKSDELTLDHKNGDIYDYQKENLRLATYSQQLANRRKVGKSPTSKYKGVYWHRINQIFIASITCAGVYRYLGCFRNEISAAKVYDKAAKEFYGEFAKLNFPEVCH
jgi:hypothetical protein